MGHSHTSRPTARATPEIQRMLAWAVAPFVFATIIGLLLLWPGGERAGITPPASSQLEQYEAEVESIEEEQCPGAGTQPDLQCSTAFVRLTSGPDTDEVVPIAVGTPNGQSSFKPGDSIIVSFAADAPPDVQYSFVDYQRSAPLFVLALLFAVVVVLLSRWRGLAALAGLAISLFVLIKFVMPAILEGTSPLLVTIVGASAIMLVTLYISHGLNVRTTTAVLGTLASLAITGILALVFVEAAKFTGLASEEALFLQLSAGQVNLKGLLLGGVIIGALGVLDDVTVTQSSAVWELHLANPANGFAELYRAAVRIGRDHIASTVNTLVLAYAGSSLPLLILFSVSNKPLGETVTSEVVAEEVVRTLVGSIGLVASVPITTTLAAAAITRSRFNLRPHTPRTAGAKEGHFRPPKAEQEWRDFES